MRIFGSLEAEIMPIMWRRETATVKQVHREIVDWRDLAYTTVMTTMERLTEKGVLKREKRGLAYVYTLAHSREEYAAQAVRQIIEQVLDGDATALVGTSIEVIARSQ
jgi:predicted transcriptional regulator